MYYYLNRWTNSTKNICPTKYKTREFMFTYKLGQNIPFIIVHSQLDTLGVGLFLIYQLLIFLIRNIKSDCSICLCVKYRKCMSHNLHILCTNVYMYYMTHIALGQTCTIYTNLEYKPNPLSKCRMA